MKDDPAGICVSCITKCAIAESEFDAMDYKYPVILSCDDYKARKKSYSKKEATKDEDWRGLDSIPDSDWHSLSESFWEKT